MMKPWWWRSPSEGWKTLFFAALLFAYGGSLAYAANRFSSSKYSERKIQEGSLFGLLYEDEMASARGSVAVSEIASLRRKVADLEERVAKLEAAKKK